VFRIALNTPNTIYVPKAIKVWLHNRTNYYNYPLSNRLRPCSLEHHLAAIGLASFSAVTLQPRSLEYHLVAINLASFSAVAILAAEIITIVVLKHIIC